MRSTSHSRDIVSFLDTDILWAHEVAAKIGRPCGIACVWSCGRELRLLRPRLAISLSSRFAFNPFGHSGSLHQITSSRSHTITTTCTPDDQEVRSLDRPVDDHRAQGIRTRIKDQRTQPETHVKIRIEQPLDHLPFFTIPINPKL